MEMNQALTYYQPKRLRNRHLAMMEEMVANPSASQNELAEKLGLTPSRFSIIVNSPIFVYAFKEYRREHMGKISDLAAEATTAALKFSKEIVENKNVDIPLRQVSAKDILGQGHAKAVEKRASLNIETVLPPHVFDSLEGILKEVSTPFVPTRNLTVPQGEVENDG